MKQGISKIRNPVIARFFREANLIEQWGTGVPRMFKQAQELGLPEPQSVELGMRVRFIVHLAEQVRIQIEQVAEQVAEQVTEQVMKLLESLEKEPLSTREAMKTTATESPSHVLVHLSSTCIAGRFVEMTQPDSPKSPTQKYQASRITDGVDVKLWRAPSLLPI